MQSSSTAFDVDFSYSPSQEDVAAGQRRADALWSRKHAGKLILAAALPALLLITAPFLLLGNGNSSSEHHSKGNGASVSASFAGTNEAHHFQKLRQPGVRSGVQLEEQQSAPRYDDTPRYEPSPRGIATSVGGNDVQALTYDSAGNKMATLHALAMASRETRRLTAPKQLTPEQQWSNMMTGAEKAAASLKHLHGGGSALHQARARISKVLAQSMADKELGKQVLRTAAEARNGDDNTWDKMLKREVGPQSVQMASDWLSTEVASAPSGAKKSMYARAQLEAALSRVGGKVVTNKGLVAPEMDRQARGNRGLEFEREAAERVMSRATSTEDRGQLFGRGFAHRGMRGQQSGGYAPMMQTQQATQWQAPAPAGPSAQAWGGGQVQEGGQYGGAPQGGAQPKGSTGGGIAPGLSDYDAQILAHGPPS